MNDKVPTTDAYRSALLEAAHIAPYRAESDHHSENELLLRADIHTLFDLNLLGIEPEKLMIELHPRVADEYRGQIAAGLTCSAEKRPSEQALRFRYQQFNGQRQRG